METAKEQFYRQEMDQFRAVFHKPVIYASWDWDQTVSNALHHAAQIQRRAYAIRGGQVFEFPLDEGRLQEREGRFQIPLRPLGELFAELLERVPANAEHETQAQDGQRIQQGCPSGLVQKIAPQHIFD